LQYVTTHPAKLWARIVVCIAAVAALATLAKPASAQQQSVRGTSARSETAPIAIAALAERGTPHLDGRLDDPVWQTAEVVTGFTQVRPNDGTEPSELTEVRIVYDRDALYVGARCYDSEPDAILATLSRRDQHGPSDLFNVMIDSYHDHRTTFEFQVNPAAVRTDYLASNDVSYGDISWDPVWEVATSIDSLGWVAEMRIPFSQLRFPDAAEQQWGINFSRFVFRKDELQRWSWAPNTETGYASLFGHLHGLRDIPAPRGLEILPYTVAQSDFTEGADPANPFNDGSAYDVTAGFDMKYGVTSELTLDASVNPDFGQVEADPAVVNLSAFETFFEERRPFFVEGSNLFEFGSGSGGFVFGAPQLFYSRRIGRSPARHAEAADAYVDNPTSSRILGAAKLSGKTAGWSIGVLEAVTSHESASIQHHDGTTSSEPVEPFTNFGVVSLRKDLRDGGSGIGVLATGLQRHLNDPLFEGLRSQAYSTGVDFFHKFGDNQFAINGSLSASHIVGDSIAIASAQRSSARYYQRPDQDYVSVNPTARSMTGYAASMTAGKVAGNWTYGMDFFAYAPGFEINDAGFQNQTDRVFQGIRLGRRWLDPGKLFREFRVNATFAQNWNFGGTNLSRQAYLGINGSTLNFWFFNLGGNYSLGGQSDKATRGGPLMESPGDWGLNGFVGSDFRKPVSVGTFGNYSRDEYGGWDGSIGTNINVRPTAAVTVNFGPSFNKSRSSAFYVTQRVDPTAAATFGSRYLFSNLEQNSVNARIRVDVALTPDLSIQLYAQPFIASGDYEEFKELSAPGTYDFSTYGVDHGSTMLFDPEENVYTADPDGTGPAEQMVFGNPDFRFRSLRSNLVVRWEYTPGSTLFLVWNHGQSGYNSDPTFSVFNEFGNLLRDDQRNTFLVKVNYWLSR
jgi:hypothetical protein